MKPPKNFEKLIKCCLINARSLCNKISDFKLFATAQQYSVLCVTETWLNEEIPDALISGTTYKIYRADRNGRGGGVAVLIKNNIQHTHLELHEKFDPLEVIVNDLLIPIKHRIGCIYRSPDNDTDYLKLMVDLFNQLCDVSHPVTIVGDFNLPLFNWQDLVYPDSEIYNHFADCITQNGLSQLINEPTRGENILDLVLTTSDLNVPLAEVMEPFGTSDHNSVCFHICGTGESATKPVSYDFRKADIQGALTWLLSIDWSTEMLSFQNVQEKWDFFSAKLDQVCDLFVPKKAAKVSNNKSKYPVYINSMLAKKRKLWRIKTKNKLSTQALANYNTWAKRCSVAVSKYCKKKEHKILSSGDRNKFFFIC